MFYGDEEELLIERNDEKLGFQESDKQLLWLSLSSPKSASILSRKRWICLQLSIVCVLFFFSLFCVLLILAKLSAESQQSINRLVDRFSFLTTDDTNETDIIDTIFSKTRLRHGSVRVITHCGTLIGGKESDAYAFKGIPYAHPPVGDRRWTPPEPLCNPDSHRHCHKFGSHCFQVNPISRELEGREDCLYLNVWTPTIDPEVRHKTFPFEPRLMAGPELKEPPVNPYHHR
ncbi:unnamed protein product [Medioppia subpectinata]|uniref:Carboxylesterase type B domain-containing protein n=1 Tax=Medioppia subpectinata TaxID=1979941 RepID=A0A7R9Q391_9ACAR|nr:unnamed protein product [Medioppia subpectinata]CAG2110209.1 unnamed protein product [Medioppia subpectinata]